MILVKWVPRNCAKEFSDDLDVDQSVISVKESVDVSDRIDALSGALDVKEWPLGDFAVSDCDAIAVCLNKVFVASDSKKISVSDSVLVGCDAWSVCNDVFVEIDVKKWCAEDSIEVNGKEIINVLVEVCSAAVTAGSLYGYLEVDDWSVDDFVDVQ